MKDLTPIDEQDVVLKRRHEVAAMGLGRDGEGERLTLLNEEQMQKKRERYEACVPVAHDILEEARASLAVRFRFLDRALWRMPLEPSFDMHGISTDGVRMVYDPVFVVERFKLSHNEVVRDVVHCLFHCIFRHPFMLYSVLREPWDVACDIAIESMLIDLLGDAFPSNMDGRAKRALRILRAQVGGVVTAERLYHLFSNEGNMVDLRSLAPIFFHDTHGLWYGPEEEWDARRGSTGAQKRETRDSGDSPGATPDVVGSTRLDEVLEDAPTSADAGGQGDSDSRDEADSSELDQPELDDARDESAFDQDVRDEEELAREWEDISRDIQVELEMMVMRRGDEAGSLLVGLSAINREKHDYADFLRRFATLHERMRVNDDEFDYIYYTFGLKRYGNMPLIEPLEYKEDRAIHDFVIAIDTSESCSGDTVQAFMRKTYNILKQVESFNSRVNIHIVQCDARVQEDTKITSLDELDLYLEDMQLRGFGGTDFRPVFDYVNLLIEKGEFTDLKGLVYFTDGEGVFPRRQPAYDSVFVFLDDGYSDPMVPPWALKVILNERDLQVKEAR